MQANQLVIDYLHCETKHVSRITFIEEIQQSKTFCTMMLKMLCSLKISFSHRFFLEDTIVDRLANIAWVAFKLARDSDEISQDAA